MINLLPFGVVRSLIRPRQWNSLAATQASWKCWKKVQVLGIKTTPNQHEDNFHKNPNPKKKKIRVIPFRSSSAQKLLTIATRILEDSEVTKKLFTTRARDFVFCSFFVPIKFSVSHGDRTGDVKQTKRTSGFIPKESRARVQFLRYLLPILLPPISEELSSF
jgi:hypothetical protein